MKQPKHRGAPQTLEDCECGDIVRCDAGLVRVGPPLAGDLFCALVELDGDGYRPIAEPIFMAPRTRVLELLRDRSWYAGNGGREVDPLKGEP